MSCTVEVESNAVLNVDRIANNLVAEGKAVVGEGSSPGRSQLELRAAGLTIRRGGGGRRRVSRQPPSQTMNNEGRVVDAIGGLVQKKNMRGHDNERGTGYAPD